MASICLHRGEEPAVSGPHGICNIFFTNCNLRCLYCQNYQISDRRVSRTSTALNIEEVISQVVTLLEKGITHVGFVSPSHFVPQVKLLIRTIGRVGYKPVWVYNTNAYDRVETLRSLEGMIDVYLPDLKYMDGDISASLSGAADYPEVASAALREMYRQKGSALHLDDRDTALSGLIVRHLVLPGYIGNSLKVIRFLAEEISPKVHLSLMSQFYPVNRISGYPALNRTIFESEYQQVIDEMERFGIHRGWVQDFESSDFYRPDFENDHPFEQHNK